MGDDDKPSVFTIRVFDDGERWEVDAKLDEKHIGPGDFCQIAEMTHEAINAVHRKVHIDEVVEEILDEARN